MPTLHTMLECGRHARPGIGFRNKKLAFLLAGFGIMGLHRQKLRDWYFRSITRQACNGAVRLTLRRNGEPTRIELRTGNEADYLIGGEFVRGSYALPPSTPKAVVDAGANIGLFAIHAKRHFPQARLICYEPDPSNFVQLRNNLSLNSINAEFHQAGVWSATRTLYYHVSQSHLGYVDENPPGQPIPCMLPEIPPACWLKLDVEGAEFQVLPALFEQQTYPGWISMEIHQFNTRGHALMALLRKHGYNVDGGEDPAAECTTVTASRVSCS